MEVKEKIKKILKSDNIEKISKYKDTTLTNIFLELLDDEMNDFSYDDSDIDYLDYVVKKLPSLIEKHQKVSKADEKLKIIHQKIKTYLVQKPGNLDKTNHNYKILKNMINDIEMIQMSILYDYVQKYEGSKYELIDYIIFETNNISLFNDALNRFPFLVNYFDKNGKNLIVSVTDAYIDAVNNYENAGIDSIIFYDQVIESIFNSKEFMFDPIDKQTILKKIRESLKSMDVEKEKKTFYFNTLTERINENKIEMNDSYLEYKFNIRTEFNESINSEVRQIVNNYSISKDRRIIDDYILSFDGENTKEIDDALSVKILDNGNILLGVHIADPLDLIDENSIIFDEAAKRTTSIYLSDKSIPMFPPELSTNLVSLTQKNYRPATSYYFEFDKNGYVVKSNFVKSVIKVNRNMSYSDFNKISKMNSNDELKKTVDNLSLVSNILQRYYNVDPLYEKINRSSNNITNTNIIGSSSGEKVVESSMIFTNQMVAKYFADRNLPFIFRNHCVDPDLLIQLDKLKKRIKNEHGDKDAYLKYIDMVTNLYPKALYDVECKGHQGLNIDYYSHVTSPLRRLADVIALICLDRLYFNVPTKESKEEVRKLVLVHSNNINTNRNSKEKYAIEHEKLRKVA